MSRDFVDGVAGVGLGVFADMPGGLLQGGADLLLLGQGPGPGLLPLALEGGGHGLQGLGQGLLPPGILGRQVGLQSSWRENEPRRS